MTSVEMATAFKFRLDKIDSLNYPNFLSSEIDLLLNQAQERIIKQRYGLSNVKRESFEETQKRTEDLKAVVVNSILTPAANASDNISANAQFVTLPTDHWFIVYEDCRVSYADCKNQTVTDQIPVYPIQHNEVNKVIKNSFLKANKQRVLRLMENGRVELIHDPLVTITSYHLRYIKKPNKISSVAPLVNCELSDHMHDELVDQAVLIALEDIESRRLQTYNSIDKTNE